jgi:hypothetical protein
MGERTEHEHRHSPKDEVPRVLGRYGLWRRRLWALFALWFAYGLFGMPWKGTLLPSQATPIPGVGRLLSQPRLYEVNQPVLALTVYLPAAGLFVLFTTRRRRPVHHGLPPADPPTRDD